jgi:hypothetical protein
MKNKDFFNSGLLEKYIMGLTTPEESERVEELIANFPEIKAHYLKLSQQINEFAENQAIRRPASLLYPGKRALQLMTVVALTLTFSNIFQYRENLKNIKENNSLLLLLDQCKINSPPEIILNPQSRSKDLQTPFGNIKFFYNTDSKKGLLYLNALEKAPDGFHYQIWEELEDSITSIGFIPNSKLKEPILIHISNESKNIHLTLECENRPRWPNLETVVLKTSLENNF